MPGTRHAPTLEAQIAGLQRRISQLERKLGAVIDTRIMPAVFSFAGPVPLSIESPAWRPVHPVEIALVVPYVLTPPSGGDLVIDLNVYGVGAASPILTLTIPDGQNYVEVASPFRIGMGAALTALPTSVNAAADLSIAVVPRLLI